MIVCRDGVDLLDDYIDGELSPESARALEQHLAGCESCEAFINTYRATRGAVGALRAELMPEELRIRLQSFLRQKIQEEQNTGRPSEIRSTSPSMLFTRSSPFVLACLRIIYGILWLQQATWKVPPDFGRQAGDGLWFWLQQAVQHPILGLHHAFLTKLVLPNFIFFGYLTLATELFIGMTLTLGVLSRLGAFVGLAMSINVTLSVLRVPGEWAWAYYMLIGYSLLFCATHPGRVLGLDALWARRAEVRVGGSRWAKLLTLLT